MKKIKIVNGKPVPVETEEKIIVKTDDKELQEAYDKYNKLLVTYKKLNQQAKALFDLTDKISVSNELVFINGWYQMLDKLDTERMVVYKHKFILYEISKYFLNSADKVDSSYNDKKQLFIYSLDMYESELLVYKAVILSVEKLKKSLNLNFDKQR